MTLMRGVGLVVLTPEGVRQRSDISHTAFELRSLARPCLSSEQLSELCPSGFKSLPCSQCMKPGSLNVSHRSKVRSHCSYLW